MRLAAVANGPRPAATLCLAAREALTAASDAERAHLKTVTVTPPIEDAAMDGLGFIPLD